MQEELTEPESLRYRVEEYGHGPLHSTFRVSEHLPNDEWHVIGERMTKRDAHRIASALNREGVAKQLATALTRLIAAADHSHEMGRITAALCSEAEVARAALRAYEVVGKE